MPDPQPPVTPPPRNPQEGREQQRPVGSNPDRRFSDRDFRTEPTTENDPRKGR